MIRVSVMYPAGDGATFDMDYYKSTHMPLVQRVMPGVIRTECDQAIDGPNIAVGHLYFESMEAMNAAMAAGAGEAMADIPNFTNTQAAIQVSQMVE